MDKEIKPSEPVKKTASIVNGINGKTRIFANTPIMEICPIIYRMNGDTNICVEIVAAKIPRISNFSGINHRNF